LQAAHSMVTTLRSYGGRTRSSAQRLLGSLRRQGAGKATVSARPHGVSSAITTLPFSTALLKIDLAWPCAVNGPPGGAGRRDRAYSRFRRRAAVPSSGATPGWRCSKIAVRSPRAGSAASRNCLSHRRGTAGLPTPPIRVPDARPSCGGWVPRAVALGASRRRRAPLPGAPPEVRIF
jgi:hypothetical protein